MNRIVDYSGGNYAKAVQASFETRNDLVVVRGILSQYDIDGVLADPSNHAEYFGQTALASQINNPFTAKLIPIFHNRGLDTPERRNKRIDGELILSTIINLSIGSTVFAKRISESTDSQDVIEEQYKKWESGSVGYTHGSLVRVGEGVIIPRGVVYAIEGHGEGRALVVNSKK